MRRITLAAPQFADFGIEEPGEIVTLGWPDPGSELVLPWGRGHVWGAGESRTMRAELRGRPGVERLQVLGYWSRAR
jgi:hypothetical protein